ncbi:MAG: LD-carboxypeptidase, partial [Thermodesulfobacteriota bacterium]
MPDNLVIPPALALGGLIGAAAPAGPFPLDRFENGLDRLKSLGFQILVPPEILEKQGFLAGPDRLRASILNRLLADPQVGAVIGARGGYGSMRLLDRLDYRQAALRPKIVLGFSDLTALLLALHQKSGLVTFHGPVVTSLAEADQESVDHLARLLLGRPVFPLSLAGCRILREGRTEGRLWGGNLTLIVHLLATDWLPPFDGAVLFLEDTSEPPYRLDRL